MINRICDFVVEIKSVYWGRNSHEAALGEGLGAWLTSEQSTAPRQVSCLNWRSDYTLETQQLGFSSTGSRKRHTLDKAPQKDGK